MTRKVEAWGPRKPLFSEAERSALRKSQLPRPTVTASLTDLDGAVLFGAGSFALQLLAQMRRAGMEPAWFVDNNPSLWGTTVEGVLVKSAKSLREVSRRLVVIASSFFRSMVQDCIQAGVTRWTYFSEIPEVFGHLSVLALASQILDNDEVERLAEILRDSAESLEVYKRVLAARITGDTVPCSFDQYFVEQLIPEHCYTNFVDCGAYDGDTLLEWSARKAPHHAYEDLSYHAFEPDPANFQALAKNIETIEGPLKSRVTLHRSAVGDRDGELLIVSGGPGSATCSRMSGGQSVPVERLDMALANEAITAIKMDVESFELEALQGARQLISRQRPALLITVYHRTEHLWEIPLWIYDLGFGYRIHLRHHSRTFGETVCYAVPHEALTRR